MPTSIMQIKRQFAKWEVSKNLTETTWRNISHHFKARSRAGKVTKVFLHGKDIEERKVRKEVSRYRSATYFRFL